MKAAPTGIKAARVVMVVEGGNVQEVLGNLPDIEVRLIDYDNEPEAEEPDDAPLAVEGGEQLLMETPYPTFLFSTSCASLDSSK